MHRTEQGNALFNKCIQNDFSFPLAKSHKGTASKVELKHLKFERYPPRWSMLGPQDLGQCLAHSGHWVNMSIGYVTYPNIYWTKTQFSDVCNLGYFYKEKKQGL